MTAQNDFISVLQSLLMACNFIMIAFLCNIIVKSTGCIEIIVFSLPSQIHYCSVHSHILGDIYLFAVLCDIIVRIDVFRTEQTYRLLLAVVMGLKE